MVSDIQEIPKVLVNVSEDMLYSPVCDIEEAVYKDANVPLSIQGVIQKVNCTASLESTIATSVHV